jgi:hypothetical protein
MSKNRVYRAWRARIRASWTPPPVRQVKKGVRANKLEREGKVWEITTMQAVKIDKQKRVRLKIFTAGDYYQPDFSSPAVITLRRIDPPKPKQPLTADQIKRALKNSRIKMKYSWEELRQRTREP